jgi:hypothetical protein
MICNTLNLCGNAGPSYTGNPTTLIAGVCPALNGTQTIISATPNAITLNVDTTAGCTYTSGGTASYAGSATQLGTFATAAMQDSQLTPYELQQMQNFYASGATACPAGSTCPSPTPYSPVSTRYPTEYEESDGTEWTKYWGTVYNTGSPVPVAVGQFNASP